MAERLADLLVGEPVDLTKGGYVLERNRPYLIELRERLNLPDNVRAKANPKSSTGRLDIFTRTITDKNYYFDDVKYGHKGRLYVEVVPRSFLVKVHPDIALNQLRLFEGGGGSARISDHSALHDIHLKYPLLYSEEGALPADSLPLADDDAGLFLSVDLAHEGLLGYRARRNAPFIDLARVGEYEVEDFWEEIQPERGQRFILQPDEFYLLLSSERVAIPPELAAEMAAYDPSAGELRTHYAGFFDPGFGFDPEGAKPGARAVLEVRARDVPFMVEHRQRICKLTFERMVEPPELLYGEAIGSSYQFQELTLSKHFRQHRQRQPERQLDLLSTPRDS